MIIEDMASSQTTFHDTDPPEYASETKSALLRRGHSYSQSTAKLLPDEDLGHRAAGTSDGAYDTSYGQPYYAEAAHNPAYNPSYPEPDYSYNPGAYSRDDAQGKQEIQEISYAKTPEQYGMRNYQNMGEEYTLCIPFLLT